LSAQRKQCDRDPGGGVLITHEIACEEMPLTSGEILIPRDQLR
jgi:hypothetical protein